MRINNGKIKSAGVLSHANASVSLVITIYAKIYKTKAPDFSEAFVLVAGSIQLSNQFVGDFNKILSV
ncbi:hypothetical protein B4N84_06325 [Flavobacterium sp. IR1]|nr:hypothetical protein B4N84_06325 [Flavobacterium sp. IR1]